MKILMTLPFPGIKGPLNEHIPLLIEELENNGVEIEKFYYGKRKENVFFLLRIFHITGSLIGFLRIILFGKVQIVQLNTSFDKRALLRDVLFVFIARLTGKKVFVKMHGSFYDLLDTKNIFWIIYIRLLFVLSNYIGVLSIRERDEFSAAFKQFRSKFLVMKNPIDVEFLRTSPEVISWGKKPLHILYASRIMREKGIFDLINVIPEVLKKVDAHFIFAGSGKDEVEAQLLIERLNLSNPNCITWLGNVPSHKMKDIFRSVDLFVFPTYFPEGMPMALVNAMALGLPIITTRVRFAYDYFKEPNNCFFIKQNNPEQLTDKIIYLLDHPKLRDKMHRNNKGLDAEFDKKIVAQEYLKLYTTLLKAGDLFCKKKRILLVIPLPPPYAGPEVASKVLLDFLSIENFDIISLCSNVHKRNRDKGKISFLSTTRFIRLIFRIFWTLLFKQPEAVYTQLSQNFTGFIRDSVIIRIAKIFHKEVILHFHGSNFESFYGNQSEHFKSYISSTLKKADNLIIQVGWLKEFFSQFISKDKMKVIYNPINRSQFIYTPQAETEPAQDAVKVLYLSNISAAKGFLVLAKAMQNIIREGHKIKFIIAGSVIDKERNIFYGQDGKKIDFQGINRVMHEIKNSAVFNDSIIFLSEIVNLSEKTRVLNQADIFVLPSYSEGCPMAVLEAMAAGLPVVVTRVGALTEIIEDSVNGFFVDINNSVQLKEKILLLAGDSYLRKKIGRENQLLITRKFEIGKIIPQFDELFSKSCGDKENQAFITK